MGFNKFLKTIGIEDANDTQKNTPANAGTTPANVNTFTTGMPQTKFPVPPPNPVVTQALDQTYLDHFQQYLESKNIEGLDYWEFATSLHTMYEKFGTTVAEAQLYAMAYTLFESQGIKADRLIQTAEQYENMILEHKKEFDAHLATEGSQEIQAKTLENEQLSQKISNAAQQIETLQKQIVALQQQATIDTQTMESNKQIIADAQAQNDAKRGKFEAAMTVVLDKIKGDIAKIKTYLK